MTDGRQRPQTDVFPAAWNAEDTTLVHVRWRGQESSGLEFDSDLWTVNRFKGDLISRIEYYLDEQSARTAL